MSYLFHATRSKQSAQRIIEDGWLRPHLGTLSFTHDPFFLSSVSFNGYTFVFPEEVIYGRYHGRDVDYSSPQYIGADDEAEVATKVPVNISDAVEILPTVFAVRKYGMGWKYPYKDVRDKKEGLRFRLKRL